MSSDDSSYKHKYWFNFTMAQHTPGGDLLESLYYGGTINRLFTREECNGCPHNGGEHTLGLRITVDDAKAFVETIGDLVSEKNATKFTGGYHAFKDRLITELGLIDMGRKIPSVISRYVP